MEIKAVYIFVVCLTIGGAYASFDPDAIPEITEADLDRHLYDYFSAPRNFESSEHVNQLWTVRALIQGAFGALRREGVTFERDEFIAKVDRYGNVTGINYYLTFQGEKYNTSEDKIVSVIAHYESAKNACGTDNNGAGMSALLEIARVISALPCKLPYTILLVANDLEEEGSHGIKHFIHNYLVPRVLKNGAPGAPQYQGAFFYDTIMNWNDTANSQVIPEIGNFNSTMVEAIFALMFPDLYSFFIVGNRAGDFILPMARRFDDRGLYEPFLQQWQGLSDPSPAKYRGHVLDMDWNGTVPRNPTPPHLVPWLRSDYKEFYYYNGTVQLKGILITDSAQYRGVMAQCYAQWCDNYDQVTPEKLTFLRKIAKTTLHTVLNLAEYHCTPNPTTPMPTTGGAGVSELTFTLKLGFTWWLYLVLVYIY